MGNLPLWGDFTASAASPASPTVFCVIGLLVAATPSAATPPSLRLIAFFCCTGRLLFSARSAPAKAAATSSKPATAGEAGLQLAQSDDAVVIAICIRANPTLFAGLEHAVFVLIETIEHRLGKILGICVATRSARPAARELWPAAVFADGVVRAAAAAATPSTAATTAESALAKTTALAKPASLLVAPLAPLNRLLKTAPATPASATAPLGKCLRRGQSQICQATKGANNYRE